MIRHLVVPWPDPTLAKELGRPFRILAVSDDEVPTLDSEVNRRRVEPVDLVIGCGDLAADYLGFVADAFVAPVAYVRGNHDHGTGWTKSARSHLPSPVPPSGLPPDRAAGLRLVGLGWPGVENEELQPSERRAWAQTCRALLAQVARRGPLVVISHVPPRGLGDMPDSNYHRGFAGYRWLADRLVPALWLHGHVHPAAAEAIVVQSGRTPVINVTGATVLDLDPDAIAVRPGGQREPEAATPAAAAR